MLGKQGGDGHKPGGGPFYQNDLTVQGKEGKQQRGMNQTGRFPDTDSTESRPAEPRPRRATAASPWSGSADLPAE